jgi:hypothetical protein
MFEEFFQRRREKKAIREWQNSLIGKTLANHTTEYFTKYPRLADFSNETKDKIVGDFYQAIFNLPQTENPFLAMRERLAYYLGGFAGFQVLCLTEEEKSDSFYSDCPYISGQLHHHIDEAVKHIDELQELKWKYPDISNSDLVSFCNSRCVLHLYYLNGFNYVRSEFNDHDMEKDWLQPFLKSELIWHEETIRRKIGLQSLLPNSLDGLKHSTFMNMVVNGNKNPYFEWEKKWLMRANNN